MTTNGRPNSDDLLSAHLDGELTAAERAATEELLETSADALAELDDYRTLSELLRSLPAEPAPAGLRSAVMQRIEQEAAPKSVGSARGRMSRRWILGMVGGGIAVAAGLFLAISLSHDDPLATGAAQLAVNDRAESTADAAQTPALQPSSERLERLDIASSAVEMDAVSGAASADFNDVAELGASLGVSASELAVGDVFSYFEQTQAGDVVVVEATVVDVRLALNQLQVLLNKNSIPTATVAFRESQGLAGKTAGAIGRTSGNGELAVFIESEPTQMNAALTELRQQLREESNAFLGLQVTGVLDAPQPAASPSDESSPAGDSSGSAAGFGSSSRSADVPVKAEPARSRTPPVAPISAAAEADRDKSSADAEPGRGGGSMPDRAPAFGNELGFEDPSSRRLGETESRERYSQKSAAPSLESVRRKSPASGDETQEQLTEAKDGAAEAYAYGYQTVLNVSKSDLKKLQTPIRNPAPAADAAKTERQSEFYFIDPPAAQDGLQSDSLRREVPQRIPEVRQRGQQAGESLEVEPEAGPEAVGRSQISRTQPGQRRLRLLVVLESKDDVPLKADSQPAPRPPIEAPQPGRKKG